MPNLDPKFDEILKKLGEVNESYNNQLTLLKDIEETVSEILDLLDGNDSIKSRLTAIINEFDNNISAIQALNDKYKDAGDVVDNIASASASTLANIQKINTGFEEAAKSRAIVNLMGQFDKMSKKVGDISTGDGGNNNGGGGRSEAAQEGKISKFLDILGKVGGAIKGAWDQFGSMDTPLTALNRQVGMSYDNFKGVKNRMMHESIETTRKFGVDAEKIAAIQGSIFAETNRNLLLTNEQLHETAAVSVLLGSSEAVGKFVGAYDKIGGSIGGALKQVQSIRQESGKYGVDMTKATSLVEANLQKAQTYGFRDGVNSLTRMAAKALSLRMDMSQVFAFADKNRDIESAITNSAKTQVLGGAFSTFADPLTNMFNSLADNEANLERIANLGKDMMFFNKEKGISEFKGDYIDRERARAFASANGLDFEKLTEGWSQTAKIEHVGKFTNTNLDEGQKAFAAAQAQWNTEKNEWEMTVLDKTNNLVTKSLKDIKSEELERMRPDTEQNNAKQAAATIGTHQIVSNWFKAWEKSKGIAASIADDPMRGATTEGWASKIFNSDTKRYVFGGVATGAAIIGGIGARNLSKKVFNRVTGSKKVPTSVPRPTVPAPGAPASPWINTGIIDPSTNKMVYRNTITGQTVSGNPVTGAKPTISPGNSPKPPAPRPPAGGAKGNVGGKVMGKLGGKAVGRVLGGAGAGVGAAIDNWDDLWDGGSRRQGQAWAEVAGATVAGIALSFIPVVGPILAAVAGPYIGKLVGKLFEVNTDLNDRSKKLGQAYSKTSSQKSFMEDIDQATDPIFPLREIAKSTYNIEAMLRSKFEMDENNLTKKERKELKGELKDRGENYDKYRYTGGKYRSYAVAGADKVDDYYSAPGSPTIIQKGNKAYLTSPSDTVTASKNGGLLERAVNATNSSQRISMSPMDINISGTLQLSGGGQNIDISQVLKDPNFISSITNLVTKSINEKSNMGVMNSATTMHIQGGGYDYSGGTFR
jgi:hypothetical protein